jgi:hypothetical protein
LNATANRRVLAIVTDDLDCSDSIEEIRREAGGDGVELWVVVPAFEPSTFRHALGDVDEPRREAEARLESALRRLRDNGLDASGEVGDPDPVQAAQDALQKEPADEILIFEHAGSGSRWFEDGLFDRARKSLEPPLRLVDVEHADGGEDHVLDVGTAEAGTVPDETEHEIGSSYIPGFSRGDLLGIVAAIVGTILAAVLAAVVAADSSKATGWEAAAILIAIGTALINMAHVVGLTLFESVRYRGGFATLFRMLSLVGTPVAVLVNLLIVLFAS